MRQLLNKVVVMNCGICLLVFWCLKIMLFERHPAPAPVQPVALPFIDPEEVMMCEGGIPHRMLFTYKHNILESGSPSNYFDNIQRTIQEYRLLWNDLDTEVLFFDDQACQEVIGRVEPKLIPYFVSERQGMYKADMCRVAALYEVGGYYFDIDLEVIEPLALKEADTCFTTVLMDNNREFFQAFLAVAPKNLVLKQALHIMLEHYEGKHEVIGWMGTATLKDAYDSIFPPNRGKVQLLSEIKLTEGVYPNLKRRVAWGNCNYVVHDATEARAYFYSRMVGATNCGSFWTTMYNSFMARLPSTTFV